MAKMYAEQTRIKTCTKCLSCLDENNFYKSKQTKSGFHPWCKKCFNEGLNKARKANPEKHNERNRNWVQKNKVKNLEMMQNWRKQNSEKCASYQRKYRSSQKGKIALNAINKARYESGYRKAWASFRRKGIKQATPKWVIRTELTEFYKNRPKGYHVDHIIPLNGKNISGLNVVWNLQYLPASENLKKSNKF
jgi:hypothetical protein